MQNILKKFVELLNDRFGQILYLYAKLKKHIQYETKQMNNIKLKKLI